jgi:hypothetical protein
VKYLFLKSNIGNWHFIKDKNLSLIPEDLTIFCFTLDGLFFESPLSINGLTKIVYVTSFSKCYLILQVVPNTRSRSQMGETTDGGLYEIFQQDYGPVGSPKFEAARENFIISSAGYAVASLLLQPKDRHNGNLLFDKYDLYFSMIL